MNSELVKKKIEEEKKIIEIFEENIKNNETKIDKIFRKDIKMIISLFNHQYRIAREYLWSIEALPETRTETTQILLTAYLKNIISIFSAFRLTNSGLFGPARVIMRNSFEFLILSKYCSLSSNNNLLKKWERGNPKISLRNDVLNKIKKPDTKEFIDYWGLLCKYSHASIYSIQPILKITENEIK